MTLCPEIAAGGYMSALLEELRKDFETDNEAPYVYAETFVNAHTAAQIKTVREQREMSQQALADKIGTKQSGISRLENANYSTWKVETLRKIARAYGLWLDIQFKEFGELPPRVENFRKETLVRSKFEDDPVFLAAQVSPEPTQDEVAAVSDQAVKDTTIFLPPDSLAGVTHTFEALQNVVVPAVSACVESWEPFLKKLAEELLSERPGAYVKDLNANVSAALTNVDLGSLATSSPSLGVERRAENPSTSGETMNAMRDIAPVIPIDSWYTKRARRRGKVTASGKTQRSSRKKVARNA
jgi:transcriptional regulator with XRE-family HTH domain